MREYALPFFDQLLFRSAVLEGMQIIIGSVDRLAGTYAELILIGIRPEERIWTIYSLSFSEAGVNASRSTWKVNFFLFTIIFNLPYSKVIRGSTTLYRISVTRFITTINTARMIVVPMIIG